MKNAFYFALGMLVTSAASCTPGTAKTVFDVLKPFAGDAIEQLVRERWGDDAEVDIETAGCFRTDEQCGAQVVGDDDIEFVYTTCRGEAL